MSSMLKELLNETRKITEEEIFPSEEVSPEVAPSEEVAVAEEPKDPVGNSGQGMGSGMDY